MPCKLDILITPNIENNVHFEQLFLFFNNIGCAVCMEMDSSGMFISCLLKYTCYVIEVHMCYVRFLQGFASFTGFDLHLLLSDFHDGC